MEEICYRKTSLCDDGNDDDSDNDDDMDDYDDDDDDGDGGDDDECAFQYLGKMSIIHSPESFIL